MPPSFHSKLASLDGPEDAEELLRQGADLNEKDSEGFTPLMNAICSSRNDIALWMISQGALLNEQDKENGLTALHFTAINGITDVARALLEKGADFRIPDLKGLTARDHAVKHHHEDIALLANKEIRNPHISILVRQEKLRKQAPKFKLRQGP